MTKKQSKQARMDVGSPAEASPHILRASSYYQRSIHRRNRAQRRDTAKVEGGRRNPTVRALRAFYGTERLVKQPGRRFGPPPLSGNDFDHAAPMATTRRVAAYQKQNGRLLGLTARQRRQINRKSLAHARRGAVTDA